jgi:class 3 adenylate cyclase/tetratricopeptide (TPR) repeat protein
MFADLTGFTQMSEKMDPEEVYAVVTGCLKILDTVARKHGGSVDKYLGDCIMAVFGAPIAIEDAPRAAINAAIEMRERVYRYNEEHSLAVRMDIHTGINSGLMISGDVSGPILREFAVMGDVVNVAARLKDLAPRGRIYVGPETHRYTKDHFEFRAREPIKPKGKEKTVPIYEVRSKEMQLYRRRIRADERVFADLIGRDEELADLRESLGAVARGKGGIVSLIADAGLGKTRLVAELLSANEDAGVTFLEGRSLSIGQSLSFHPFADLLRKWAEIPEREQEAKSLKRLESAIAALLSEDATEVFPFVATLMGLQPVGAHADRIAGIQGEAMQKLILKSMKQLLAATSRQSPLVLIFEDLHWADVSSIELLESLLDLVKDHPILLINVFRPEFPKTSGRVHKRAIQTQPDVHKEIRLLPLDPRQSRQLIENLFGRSQLPPDVSLSIQERAGGSPFFIEEVIRSLIEEGAVESHEGVLRATEKVHLVTIPGSIREVITARMDRLEPQHRSLLQMAAVVGRSVPHDVLAELMPDAQELERDLNYLVSAQFLVDHGAQCHFKHALIQEVAYESVLRTRREELHLRVAKVIEEGLTGKLPGASPMLAYHFWLGKDLERAEHYLFEAGDEAARSAASNEAIYFFQEASRLYLQMYGAGGDSQKKALLAKNTALALFNRGNLVEAGEHFSQALEHLEVKVPHGRLDVFLSFLQNMAFVLARLYLAPIPHSKKPADLRDHEIIDLMFNRAQAQILDPARFLFDSMATLRKMQSVDPRTVAGSGGMFAGAGGGLFSFSGVSLRIGERFVRLAEEIVDASDVKDFLVFRFMNFLHHVLKGDWDERHTIEPEMLEAGLRYGQFWDVTSYLAMDTPKKIHQGRFFEASEQVERLAKIADLYAFDLAHSSYHHTVMLLHLERRELEQAFDAVETYYAAHHEDLLNILALSEKAKIQILRNDPSGAERSLATASGIIEGAGVVPPFYRSAYLRSRLLLDLSEMENAIRAQDRSALKTCRRRARGSARAAIRIAGKIAYPRPEIFRLAGCHQWLLGHTRSAAGCWSKALAVATDLGTQPELGRIHLDIGRQLMETGSGGEVVGLDAADHLAMAEKIFSELELDWDLATLRRLTAG